MSDLVLRFRVLGDGQAKSALRDVRGAALQVGRAMDQAGKSGRMSARQMGQAWSQAGRPMRAQEQLAQRVARDQARAAKQAATAQIREADRAAKAKARFAEKIRRDAVRTARAEEREAQRLTRQQERFAARAARAQETRRRAQVAALGGAVGAVGRFAARGAAVVGGAAALVGGAAIRTRFQNEDAARRLARKGGPGVTGDELLADAERTAAEVRGVRTADVLGAQDAFVTKTGDLDAARRFSKVLAEVSLATGTSADEIGGAAADLFQKFDIKSVDQMAEAMASLAVQGKRGAFELEDAARLFPRVLAAAERFGVDKDAAGLAAVGGFTQLARQSTGSGEEAATAVENAFSQLSVKSGKLSKLGVQVFDENNKGRDFRKVIAETVAATGGDLGQLTSIFGQRGIRAVSPLISRFNETRAQATGSDTERTEAGMRAMLEMFEKATDSSGALAEIQADLASAQQDNSARLTAAWEELMTKLGVALEPALEALLESAEGIDFEQLIDAAKEAGMALSEMVDFLKQVGIIKERRNKVGQSGLRYNESPEEIAARGARAQAAQVRSSARTEGRQLTDGERAELTRLDEAAKGAPRLPRSADPTQVNTVDVAAQPVNAAEFEPAQRPGSGGGSSGGALEAIHQMGDELGRLGFNDVKQQSGQLATVMASLLEAARDAASEIREMGGAARAFKENEGS